MVDSKRLRESVDRSEIVNLIGKSILTRDSGMWDRLAECYHSQAEFTSSWFKGKPSDFLGAARDQMEVSRRAGGEQKHLTANHWIEINGDHATAESDLILFMRTTIKDVELDVATWSRRLQLFAREKGEWKIYRRWVIYERDRMDAVDPTISPESYYDHEALAKYPEKLRHHLWRNDFLGSATEKAIVLRGTPEEAAAREEARRWLQSDRETRVA
jgi:hypothetical protein